MYSLRLPVKIPGLGKALYMSLIVALVLCCLLFFPEAGFSAGSSVKTLQQQIDQEQTRARTRRDSLSRLTTSERGLDLDLAALEKDILDIEASLHKEAETLNELAASDKELQVRAETLTAELEKTEAAMTGVLRVLWELFARREGVKGRDLPDWHVTDREHAWSVELFASLDAYRKTIAEQREALGGVASARADLGRKTAARIAASNAEKEKLLQRRVQYEQRLAALRRQKQETEEELTAILALVRNLNLRMQAEEAEGDIAKAKGSLPWPVIGTVRGRFNPSAKPPVRGVTVALEADTPVQAVHRGKVVHNDVLRGIGRVVIILHGEEYYSLYAFLSESPVRVGQDVQRGDIIGTSGFVTSLNGPGLYFELRYHQKVVNPEQWLRERPYLP